jgi:hypothetical protein
MVTHLAPLLAIKMDALLAVYSDRAAVVHVNVIGQHADQIDLK